MVVIGFQQSFHDIQLTIRASNEQRCITLWGTTIEYRIVILHGNVSKDPISCFNISLSASNHQLSMCLIQLVIFELCKFC
ncbi:unnamed protein product [Haemonchus placei]|uniref:Ovule protein n=1 Tax=Haemonchus placei TaxID=6290 RepID=A0A0N4VX71_HAEPC|nr:unnamed protein product [Haemonchus placei]